MTGMRKIFVDSDYLIDYLRGKHYTKELLDKIQGKHFEAYISVITVFELYTGAFLSNNSKKRFEDVETLLAWFNVIDVNKQIMLLASKINVYLRKKGTIIGIQDIIIAASAISVNIPFLTNNKKHFKNIQELEIKSWDEY